MADQSLPSHSESAGRMGGMTDSEQFIREYRTDPYTAMISHMCVNAWAMGYEAARREVEQEASDDRGLIDREHPYADLCVLLRRESGSELRNRAMRELASDRQRAEQQAILAMATLGRENPHLATRRRGPDG